MKSALAGLIVATTVLGWWGATGCGLAGTGGKQRPPCSAEGPIGALCGFDHPEDIEFVSEAGLVLVSNYRFDGSLAGGGYLSLFRPGSSKVRTIWPVGGPGDFSPEPGLGDSGCTAPPNRGGFYPHGLTSTTRDGRVLVYVAAHKGEGGGREAIEVFELSGLESDPKLAWKACIPTQGEFQANDIAVAPDGTLVVSNFQPDPSLMNMIRATLLGEPTGDIMTWDGDSGWRHMQGTESAMANGVAVTRDGRMLLYTETGTGLLYRVPLDSSQTPVSVDIGGNPDGLGWTSRGTLLATTHTEPLAYALCFFGRSPCKAGWKVVEIDPRTLAVHDLIEHDGEEVGAVSTALEAGGRIYLASVFDDRVGIVSLETP